MAHGPALSRLAASYTRDAGARDDLLQDIVLAIWQALPRFRGDCSERTFVFRIAHNRGLAHIARRRQATVDIGLEREPEDTGAGPEEALSARQQSERLLHAVRHLPVSYRQVVTLTLEGLSYGDIAAVLGITESNVGARLSRARHMLRHQLGEHSHETG